MAIPIALPVGVQVIPTVNTFTATFNTPTVNRYDFNVAANTDVEILQMEEFSIYIIERMAFSTDIAESDYQDSLDIVPSLMFKREVPDQQIFQRPMPFVNYYRDYETYMFFQGTGGPDRLLGTFRGSLAQIPATVGKTDITALVQLTIYKINDQEWIKRFLQAKNNLGAGLNMRGGDTQDPRGW